MFACEVHLAGVDLRSFEPNAFKVRSVIVGHAAAHARVVRTRTYVSDDTQPLSY
jgi:hypothetical protein